MEKWLILSTVDTMSGESVSCVSPDSFIIFEKRQISSQKEIEPFLGEITRGAQLEKVGYQRKYKIMDH